MQRRKKTNKETPTCNTGNPHTPNHVFKQWHMPLHNIGADGKITFVRHTDGVTEAAAMTEALNGGVLVTERLHMSMLPSCCRGNKEVNQTPKQIETLATHTHTSDAFAEFT